MISASYVHTHTHQCIHAHTPTKLCLCDTGKGTHNSKHGSHLKHYDIYMYLLRILASKSSRCNITIMTNNWYHLVDQLAYGKSTEISTVAPWSSQGASGGIDWGAVSFEGLEIEVRAPAGTAPAGTSPRVGKKRWGKWSLEMPRVSDSDWGPMILKTLKCIMLFLAKNMKHDSTPRLWWQHYHCCILLFFAKAFVSHYLPTNHKQRCPTHS